MPSHSTARTMPTSLDIRNRSTPAPLTPFPTTKLAFQTTNHSGAELGGLVPLTDAFVTKIDPSGEPIYSSYLGGGGEDVGEAIAVDATGRAYVTGQTSSYDDVADGLMRFPGHPGGDAGIISRHSEPGFRRIPERRLAGRFGAGVFELSRRERREISAQGLALGPDDTIFLVGSTESPDLRGLETGATGLQGTEDAFAARFRYSAATDQVPATAIPEQLIYLGGSGYDAALGVAVDQYGSAFITGATASTDFPTQGASQATYGGGGTDPYFVEAGDAFVTRLPGDESSLLGLPIQATRGLTFSGPVADFLALDPTRMASDFSAEIDWGDGTISAGTLVAMPGGAGGYEIIGTHRYAQAGAFAVVVTVHDDVDGKDITPDSDVTRLPLSQAGEDIAVYPADPSREFVVSEDPADTGGLIGSFSEDGGLTWTVRAMAEGDDNLPPALGFPAWPGMRRGTSS